MSLEEDTKLYEFAAQSVPDAFRELIGLDRVIADHFEKSQGAMLQRRLVLQKLTALVLERAKVEETARVLCLAAKGNPDSLYNAGTTDEPHEAPLWTQYVEQANEIMQRGKDDAGGTKEALVAPATAGRKARRPALNRAARRAGAAASRRKH